MIKKAFLRPNSIIVIPVDVARDFISKKWYKYKKEDHSIGDLVTFINASLIKLFEEDL
jgi:hypothetical protein